MDFFQADLGVLQQFITALRDCDDRLGTALSAMSSDSGAQLGTDALNRAADDFQHTWQYGMGQIKKMANETTGALTEAHDGYQQTDGAVAAAMARMSGAGQA